MDFLKCGLHPRFCLLPSHGTQAWEPGQDSQSSKIGFQRTPAPMLVLPPLVLTCMLDFCTSRLHYLDIFITMGCGNFPFMGDITHSDVNTFATDCCCVSLQDVRITALIPLPGVLGQLGKKHFPVCSEVKKKKERKKTHEAET